MGESHRLAAIKRWQRREYRDAQVRSHLSGETKAGNFWAKVDKRGTEDCWPWQGGKMSTGYGHFTWRGEGLREGVHVAHRIAYELLIGPIPDGLTLDHLCRNPPCCNPAHLEPVSIRENIQRAKAARTHCKHGHELTPENTYRKPSSPERRYCLICTRRYGREGAQRHRDRHKVVRTHCQRGHELTEDNWHIQPSGKRLCRPCQTIRIQRAAEVRRARDQARKAI